MASLTKFVPLDGVPDADARGAGTFHFDDGSFQVAEDPELADLVKSYQDHLPVLEQLHQALPGGLHSLPDQRLASNDLDPSAYGADPFGQTGAPEQVADFIGGAAPYAPAPASAGPSIALRQPYDPAASGSTPSVAPDPGSHAAQTAALAGTRAPGPAIQQTATDLAAPPSDAARAADLHRLAGEQALRGSYVPGQKAGFQVQSRTGALPTDLAQAQAQERNADTQGLLDATQQSRDAEAERLRKTALDEAMRISVQRADQQRIADEAEAKKQRLIAERRKINDAPIDKTYAQGDGFRQAMALLGASLLGATGSDAGLRMIQSNIDGYVHQEMQVRGSKLQGLAEELGSEEQAAAGAKAKLWDLAAKETANAGKLYDAAGIEHQTPAMLAAIKQKAHLENQEYDRQSLGKSTEIYNPGRRGGRTGPDLAGAAKQFEAANKLAPQEQAQITEGLSSEEEKDFRTRMEGIADAEHALNEIDQNIGAQRDAAGNIVNKKNLGNIEGAGGLGGRLPSGLMSEKGSALNRAVLRMTRANVKATSGAAASDTEFERAEKDTPITDEKDLVNALDEKRRELANARAKAETLYGGRVKRYLGGLHGNRAAINAQRGQSPAVGSAKGRLLQIDPDAPEEPEPGPMSQSSPAPRADSYETKLPAKEEQRFAEWRQKYVRPGDTGEDYDFRGAFKAGLHPDPENGHWPDTFKKPNHPTFSNESKYAKGQLASYAGHWKGETFVAPKKRWGGS